MTETFTVSSLGALSATNTTMKLTSGSATGSGLIMANTSGFSFGDATNRMILLSNALTTARTMTLPDTSGLLLTLTNTATVSNKTIATLNNTVTTSTVSGVTIGNALNAPQAVIKGTSSTTAQWPARQVYLNQSSGVTLGIVVAFARVGNYVFIYPGSNVCTTISNAIVTYTGAISATFRIRNVSGSVVLGTSPAVSGSGTTTIAITVPTSGTIIELQATNTIGGTVVTNLLYTV